MSIFKKDDNIIYHKEPSYHYQTDTNLTQNVPGTGIYAPFGTWKTVGCILLMGIPFIGLFIAILWAILPETNYFLKSLARAFLILWMVTFILVMGIFFWLASSMLPLVNDHLPDIPYSGEPFFEESFPYGNYNMPLSLVINDIYISS